MRQFEKGKAKSRNTIFHSFNASFHKYSLEFKEDFIVNIQVRLMVN
jgi:hypothetical protein